MRAYAVTFFVLGSAFMALSAPVACAAGVRSQGSGGAGDEASSTSAGGATSTSSSSKASSSTGTGGQGPCTTAAECAAFTDQCNTGTCVNGACTGFPANEGDVCDDKMPCTDATCVKGMCMGMPKDCPPSDSCHVGGCDMKTEQCTNTPITACMNADGCCPMGCDYTMDDDCAPPTSFKVLATANVNYQGIDYLVLQVSFASDMSIAQNWCYEYQNLCALYGFVPTGCGQMYTNMNNGYGTCRTMYGSDGISDTLGCNPSSGVAAAAQQAGFNDATGDNSFGFHYCDQGTCVKQMCSGMYCNTALSYIDITKAHGYTLCKK